MQIFKTGYIVAVVLAILTIVEYVFAGADLPAEARFAGLTVSAVAKAILIVWYFMHLARVWRLQEGH